MNERIRRLLEEPSPLRGRVQLVCPNGAVLRYPTSIGRSAAFEHGHAWRFMQGLPDIDL